MTPSTALIRPAATILMVRDDPDFEVLMVKRHHQIDFAAGALVFPGGKTHAGDHDPAWTERTLGWSAFPPDERALRIAAIREAYEEAGILLARHPSGPWFTGDERADQARSDIADDRRPLLDLVNELDVLLDLTALTVFARWITPAMMPKRFDTWFYLAAPPPEQLAACDGRETVDAEWIPPHRALAMAAAGERKVIFPTRMNIQLLAEANSAAQAVAFAKSRPLVSVEPTIERRPSGEFLVIPQDAGYGIVAEPLSAAIS